MELEMMVFQSRNDYELVCFEHSNLSRIVRPQLTSVVVPSLRSWCSCDASYLTKLMNGEEVDEKQVILPFRIEERDSSEIIKTGLSPTIGNYPIDGTVPFYLSTCTCVQLRNHM